MDKVTRLIPGSSSRSSPRTPDDTVLAPAMGGLVVGQEVARQLGVRFIFVEKENDKLVLRPQLHLPPRRRVLVAEDVVTRGGRVQEVPRDRPAPSRLAPGGGRRHLGRPLRRPDQVRRAVRFPAGATTFPIVLAGGPTTAGAGQLPFASKPGS
jgi:hypothetical protein